MPAPPTAWSLAFSARASLRHDAAAQVDIDPRDLLFFDTETTGLAGGTGTRAFMVGAADFHHHPDHGDGLRVRQLLIAAMAAEADMLRAFACWLSPRTVLASYNGRCYDAPLDRKSVVSGKSVSVRVDLGVRRIIKKKKNQQQHIHN